MSITVIYKIKCLNCGEEVVLKEGENYSEEYWEVYCPECGYTNQLNNEKIETWEQEY